MKLTGKYYKCNHHKLINGQQIVNYGTGDFIADKERMALLKALNDCGLITRTHCYGHDTEYSFVSILLDNVEIEVVDVNEIPDREFARGKKELLIKWKRTD